jgi:hypothetical protein
MVGRERPRGSYPALGFTPGTSQVNFPGVPLATRQQQAEEADWNGGEQFHVGLNWVTTLFGLVRGWCSVYDEIASPKLECQDRGVAPLKEAGVKMFSHDHFNRRCAIQVVRDWRAQLD